MLHDSNILAVKHALVALLLLIAVMIPHAVWADEPSVDLSLGTLGLAAGIVLPVSPRTDVRFVYGDATFTRTDHFSNLVVDVTANLAVHEMIQTKTAGMYVDRRLHGGAFHVSAGAIYNLNSVSGTSIPTNTTVIISGISYSQANAGLIFTTVRWPALAPYLGVGFASPNRARRIGFFGEAGVYYQGRPRVEFSSTGAIEANVAKFQPYFDEGRRQLTTELEPAQLFPVIQVGTRILL